MRIGLQAFMHSFTRSKCCTFMVCMGLYHICKTNHNGMWLCDVIYKWTVCRCLFGTLPFRMSWCATWLGVTLTCWSALRGSLLSFLIKYQAFLLLCVISVFSIRVCHVFRCSTVSACASSSPAVIYLVKHYLLHLSYYPTFSFQLLNAVSAKGHSRRRVATLYTCRHIQRRKACIHSLGLRYFISSNLNSPSGSSQFLIVRNLFQSLSLPLPNRYYILIRTKYFVRTHQIITGYVPERTKCQAIQCLTLWSNAGMPSLFLYTNF